MKIAAWLKQRGAHHDVVSWAEAFGYDAARLWAECPRGDWLLGIAARAGADRRALVAAARACAELAMESVPDDEARVRGALREVDRWLDGHDDIEARATSREAAEAAADGAQDPATQAAALAACAALGAIDEPDEAPSAASFAVQATMLDVGECAVMSALGWAQSTCADRVREHVPFASMKLP